MPEWDIPMEQQHCMAMQEQDIHIGRSDCLILTWHNHGLAGDLVEALAVALAAVGVVVLAEAAVEVVAAGSMVGKRQRS
jgi:hypothetical protein